MESETLAEAMTQSHRVNHAARLAIDAHELGRRGFEPLDPGRECGGVEAGYRYWRIVDHGCRRAGNALETTSA